MSQKRCIFHLPFTPDPINRPSGTNIRPGKMLQGFKDNGYDVFEIIGESNHRAERIREARRLIDDGVAFDFVYSESETMPTMLTDKDHLPRHPFMDFSFMKFCRSRGVPVGLFYRDAYWLSEEYAHIKKGIKGRISVPLFRYDLMQYRNAVDVLFVPSYEFASLFQSGLKEFSTCPLPSGTAVSKPLKKSDLCALPNGDEILKLAYVGCITVGDAYDMTMLLGVVRELERVQLTLCVRENEWCKVREHYEPYLNERISVVHLKGDEMKAMLDKADVGLLFFEPSQYRRLCMPVKLFEYIEHGLPVVSLCDTSAGRFVESNKCGWTTDYSKESLLRLIKCLASDPDEVAQMKRFCKEAAVRNTWEARAAYAAEVLNQVRS